MIDRDFRDVTGLLWKTCFYKQIVEFRGSLRKHANQLDALGQQVREQPSVEEFRIREQQERIYIARLTQAFLSFLSDSIAFYQKMIAEVGFFTSLQHSLCTCSELLTNKHMYFSAGGPSATDASRSRCRSERSALVGPERAPVSPLSG